LLSLIFIGHAALSGLEIAKFLIIILLSIIYIVMFFSLSSFFFEDEKSF